MSGLVALNDMDLSDGPAFECWPGSHQDEIFVELQKTEGEVQRVIFFRMRIRMVSNGFPLMESLRSPLFAVFASLCVAASDSWPCVVLWSNGIR